VIRNALTLKASNGFRKSVITAAIFGTLVFTISASSVNADTPDIASFGVELKTAMENGPSKNYQRTNLVSVGSIQKNLSKQEQWSYIAGTWEALRFIAYHFDNKRFRWLAECQDKNVGPNGFNPVTIEQQISKSLELGFESSSSATSAIMFSLMASCVTQNK
jgi:hypothetical protein